MEISLIIREILFNVFFQATCFSAPLRFPVAGNAMEHNKVDLQLKVAVHDEGSGISFTGYRTKDIWAYKAFEKEKAVNVRASQMNKRFEAML